MPRWLNSNAHRFEASEALRSRYATKPWINTAFIFSFFDFQGMSQAIPVPITIVFWQCVEKYDSLDILISFGQMQIACFHLSSSKEVKRSSGEFGRHFPEMFKRKDGFDCPRIDDSSCSE
jgi:hypothetical protein